jgi:hypothetical protein
MNELMSLAWWMAPVGLAAFLFTNKLSWAARTGRRRRRNHYKVAAKARKPMVTFMVTTR